MLGVLTDARLVTTGDHDVELAHEALLREWPRLRHWIDENREQLRALGHLERAAHDWDQAGRPTTDLYQGLRLDAAVELAHHTDALNATERGFLDASVTRRQGDQQAQQRTTRRLRRLLAGVATALILALLAGGLAVTQRGRAQNEATRARRQATAADARGLAAEAVSRADRTPDLALLLALEGRRLQNSPVTRSALLASLQRTGQLQHRFTVVGAKERLSGLSKDGSVAALADDRGGVRLVSMATGAVRQRLTSGQTGPVEAFFSDDGRFLATASPDTTIRLWDTSSGRPVTAPLPGHELPVFSVAFSPDGRLLATVDEGGDALVRQVPSGRIVARPPAVNVYEPEVAFSPDGRLLAFAASNTTVLDVRTMAPVLTVTDHPLDADWALAFSPDSKRIAIANRTDSVVDVWDIRGGRRRSRTAPVRGTYVKRLAFSTDGAHVIGGLGDGRVASWDAATGVLTDGPLAAQSSEITQLRVLQDGSRVVAGSENGAAVLRLGQASPLATRRQLSAISLSVVQPTRDGRTLIAKDITTQVMFLDANSLKLRRTLKIGDFDTGTSGMALTADGRSLVAGSSGNRIELIDVARRVKRREPLTMSGQALAAVDVSADGRFAAISMYTGEVTLVDLERWDVVRRTTPHGANPVFAVAFTADSRTLLSGGDDGRLVAQSVATGRLTTVLRSPSGGIRALTLAPNGRSLAVGSRSGDVRFIDVTTGRVTGPVLTGGNGGVTDIAFSGDGQAVAVSGLAGSVTLWDVATGQRLGDPLAAHVRTATSVAFSNDDRALFTTSVDGSMIRWDLNPASWSRRACTVASRNLTRTEWRQFLGNRAYHKTCPQWPPGGL